MTGGQGRNSETRVKEWVPIVICIPVYREPMHLRCITLCCVCVRARANVRIHVRVAFAEARKKRGKGEIKFE